MPRVYLSLGSNIDRAHHIRAGVADLRARFGRVMLSSVYESEAVGFAGDPFYNLVASFDTDLPLETLVAALRAIEDAHGRVRSGPRFSSRTLDIDLLLYGEAVIDHGDLVLPREEILKHAHVLRPLAELAPEMQHPRLGRCFRELWATFGEHSQRLWPIPFEM